MFYLNKYLSKSFPANKDVGKIIAKVEKDRKLKKIIVRYWNILVNLGAFTWVGFVLIMFLTIFKAYSSKYGDNSIIYLLIPLLVISSIGPMFAIYEPILLWIFKRRNPKVNPKIFIVYTAYYLPNRRFSPSKEVDYMKFNTKLLNISIIIFVPSLILAILLAII